MHKQQSETKQKLLQLELDNLMKIHLHNTDNILSDLSQLKLFTNTLHNDAEIKKDLDVIIEEPNQNDIETKSLILNKFGDGLKQNIEYSVTICPIDPSFVVYKQLQTELISSLYGNSFQWMPYYGPWIKSLTNVAMQKRTFPKQLKGNANLMNSTSMKLITEIIEIALETNNDFFTDIRHLSDVNSALCLLAAYFCKTKKVSLPTTYDELLKLIAPSIECIIHDLKHKNTHGSFNLFVEINEDQQPSLLPLKNASSYKKNAFSDNKLYNLLHAANIFSLNGKKDTTFSQDIEADVTYTITTTIFNSDIPPFISYQWNLRSGLAAINIFILIYLITENAQMTSSPDRRLQLSTLISQEFNNKQTKTKVFSKSEIFYFLINNYVIPTLKNYPQKSVTSLFPGIVFLSLEMENISSASQTSQLLINLTDKKYEPIFEIINQKYIFQNIDAMINARTKIRLSVESGVSAILNKPSPSSVASDILKQQFSAADDYDRLYFTVIGCIPIPVPVSSS